MLANTTSMSAVADALVVLASAHVPCGQIEFELGLRLSTTDFGPLTETQASRPATTQECALIE